MAAAAALLAVAATAATHPHGADGAFSTRPLPLRGADGGGGATTTPLHRELPSAVAIDAAGAVYVAGTSRVAASAAAGGSSGLFLLKATPLGDVLWRTDVSSGGLDAVGGLAVTPSGVYLAVTTNGRFDGATAGGGDTASGGSGGGGGGRAVAAAAGGDGVGSGEESFYDGAVLCFALDAAGPPRWAYQDGTSEADAYTAAAARPGEGSLVVAGWTSGDQFGASAGLRDVVVLELNVTGDGGGGAGVARPSLARGVQWGRPPTSRRRRWPLPPTAPSTWR